MLVTTPERLKGKAVTKALHEQYWQLWQAGAIDSSLNDFGLWVCQRENQIYTALLDLSTVELKKRVGARRGQSLRNFCHPQLLAILEAIERQILDQIIDGVEPKEAVAIAVSKLKPAIAYEQLGDLLLLEPELFEQQAQIRLEHGNSTRK